MSSEKLTAMGAAPAISPERIPTPAVMPSTRGPVTALPGSGVKVAAPTTGVKVGWGVGLLPPPAKGDAGPASQAINPTATMSNATAPAHRGGLLFWGEFVPVLSAMLEVPPRTNSARTG